jgi:hypothetical protein
MLKWLLLVPGGPDKVQDFSALDELELGQSHDAVLVERGLEGEVEAGERFDGGEPRHDERRLDATVLPQSELFHEQGIDCFERGHFAVLEAAHRRVENLDRARHLEADHGLLDAIDQGGQDFDGHGAPSWPARRRATAW